MTDDPAIRPDDTPAGSDAQPDASEPTTNAPEANNSTAPDPDAYDSPRAVQARARGLSAPYIPGGLDPDPEAALREERRNIRMLVAMVVAIVLSGFVLGYLALALGLPS